MREPRATCGMVLTKRRENRDERPDRSASNITLACFSSLWWFILSSVSPRVTAPQWLTSASVHPRNKLLAREIPQTISRVSHLTALGVPGGGKKRNRGNVVGLRSIQTNAQSLNKLEVTTTKKRSFEPIPTDSPYDTKFISHKIAILNWYFFYWNTNARYFWVDHQRVYEMDSERTAHILRFMQSITLVICG